MFREIKRSNDIWTTCIVTLGSNLTRESWSQKVAVCWIYNVLGSHLCTLFLSKCSVHVIKNAKLSRLDCSAPSSRLLRDRMWHSTPVFFSAENVMSVISTCLKYSLNSEVQMLKRCENEYICRVSGKQTRRSYTDYGAYRRYSTAKNSANIIWILISNMIQIWKNADPGWEHYVRTRCKYK